MKLSIAQQRVLLFLVDDFQISHPAHYDEGWWIVTKPGWHFGVTENTVTFLRDKGLVDVFVNANNAHQLYLTSIGKKQVNQIGAIDRKRALEAW